VYVQCDRCRGKRYNSETLDIRYKDRNIAEVLDMTVSEALQFFENIPQLRRKLDMLDEIGLGYIQLGQSATTLSGGESQRIRLSRELGKRSAGSTLYVLDEPTTGLHFTDIQKLLDVINMLANRGNTVVVIEHNLDIIKSADHIIDLGPEGGIHGGRVVAAGTPEEVSMIPESHTGRFLKSSLGPCPASNT
jgi:excinuclease ABC subunit A